jgi:hypothetical protein
MARVAREAGEERMSECIHCGEAEVDTATNDLWCAACLAQYRLEYALQELEAMHKLLQDFVTYTIKYHKSWQEQACERDALLLRAKAFVVVPKHNLAHCPEVSA